MRKREKEKPQVFQAFLRCGGAQGPVTNGWDRKLVSDAEGSGHAVGGSRLAFGFLLWRNVMRLGGTQAQPVCQNVRKHSAWMFYLTLSILDATLHHTLLIKLSLVLS